MYGIFAYMVNAGKCTNPMDPMGDAKMLDFQHETCENAQELVDEIEPLNIFWNRWKKTKPTFDLLSMEYVYIYM